MEINWQNVDKQGIAKKNFKLKRKGYTAYFTKVIEQFNSKEVV